MARANINIVGFGERKKGVSEKTKKSYDFQPVSFVYDDKWTTGQKAATANISGPDVDAIGGLYVGQTLDAVFHSFNNAIVIDAIIA